VAPALASVSAHISEPLVRLFDHHDLTRSVIAAASSVYMYYSPTPTGKPFALDYRFVSYNIPFLLALILAVPDTRIKTRLKILAFGFMMLFTIDVLMLVVGMLNYYATLDVNGQPFFSTAWTNVLYYADRFATRLNGEVPPLLIWAGLFFYYKWYRDSGQHRGKSKPAPV
jgi:hypothetical protein